MSKEDTFTQDVGVNSHPMAPLLILAIQKSGGTMTFTKEEMDGLAGTLALSCTVHSTDDDPERITIDVVDRK